MHAISLVIPRDAHISLVIPKDAHISLVIPKDARISLVIPKDTPIRKIQSTSQIRTGLTVLRRQNSMIIIQTIDYLIPNLKTLKSIDIQIQSTT
ncbi:hypothetical protein E6C27_scaffold67G006820 [Cucumis melo var. makuwa]|uniref:NBS-LRR type resistance protein n=1 Tax=Cucumis melo var. makuwa TaxID=1194695 RepID=A0A5A7TKB6_CUCMM|nr:hypothetical protein E6C27_scaffold67G006820 [Cucumis melo var. makuwa]